MARVYVRSDVGSEACFRPIYYRNHFCGIKYVQVTPRSMACCGRGRENLSRMSGGCLALMVRVCRRQSGKAGEPCQGPWALVEPRDNTVEIDRSGDRDVLQMCFR